MDKPSATKSMTSNKSPVASEDVIDGPSTSSRTASNNTTESIQKTKNKTFNVLIGVTGSVATIKLAELVKKIDSMFPRKYADKSIGTTGQASVSIRIVMTKNSQHFASKRELIKCLSDEAVEVYDDDDEWLGWKKIGDPVLHIELRKWADVMVIAPLDANTMAKLANGICDNLLTCTVRAWEVAKPLIYCPAMNVHMWEHPITREQLCKLQSFGYLRVDCVEKRLACGDVGMGAMAPVDTIANKVVDCLVKPIAFH